MDTLNDLISNPYVIRRRLAELKHAPHQNHYEYYVGRMFKVVIWTIPMGSHDLPMDDNISKHSILESVDLYEAAKTPDKLYNWVRMQDDTRFKHYEPIQYPMNPGTPYTIITCTGSKMPLAQCCELIRYLHKLEKLSAFL